MARVLIKFILYDAVVLWKDLRVTGNPKLTLFPSRSESWFMQEIIGSRGRVPLQHITSHLCVRLSECNATWKHLDNRCLCWRRPHYTSRDCAVLGRAQQIQHSGHHKGCAAVAGCFLEPGGCCCANTNSWVSRRPAGYIIG